MNFAKEDKFREWLCDKLTSRLPSSDWKVLKGKNVADILIGYQNPNRPLLLFLEIKYYHGQRNDSIPIGGSNGSGYQVEYLINKIDYLEKYLRWVVGVEGAESKSSASFLFLNNKKIRYYSTGKGIEEGKHNNLSLGKLKKGIKKGEISWMSNAGILEEIIKWIYSFDDNSDILMPVEKRQAMLDSFYDD